MLTLLLVALIILLLGIQLKTGDKVLAAIDDLKAAIDAVGVVLDNIRLDIDDIIDNLPSEGGLTAAQVDEVKAALADLQTKAQAVETVWPQAPPTDPV